jgi:MPBQ/MSBQ methyltransferase
MAELEQYVQALQEEGFDEVAVEDVSWHVAPSVAHIPFAIIRFFWISFVQQRALQQKVGITFARVFWRYRFRFGDRRSVIV